MKETIVTIPINDLFAPKDGCPLCRMEEMLAAGTTLLFVSHDANQVKRMCKKAVWLDNGVMRAFGPAEEVCDQYQKMLDAGTTSFWETEDGESAFDRAGSLCHAWSSMPVYYYHLLNA